MQQYKVFNQDMGAPPPPPQPGFGSTPPPPPPPAIQSDKASSRAIWALILGIASWVLCFGTLIPGIIAWIIGRKEVREIDEGRAPAGGRTMANIGMWLGLINTIVTILFWIGIGIFAVFVGFGSMMNNY